MDISDQYTYLFKFLIIGNAGSGKTCILRRYVEGKYIQNIPHTIGAEFGSKILNVDGTTVKIQIWDTAGQERFRSMTRSYYHNAVGALLVYDITDRDSFTALCQWLNDARQLAPPDIMIILVGNKCDLQETDENVTRWEASAFAQDNELQFMETSALTGANIDETFVQCARMIVSKIRNGELDSGRVCFGRQRSIALNERRSYRNLVRTKSADNTLSNECYC